MAREIKIVDTNNTTPIFVVDGDIYILCGGNAAMIKKYEESTPVERECAIGPNSNCDLAKNIAEEYQQNQTTEVAPLKRVKIF